MGGHNSRGLNHSVSVKAYLRSVNCARSRPLNDGQPIGSAVIGQRYANMALASASVSDRNSTHASVTAVNVTSTASLSAIRVLNARERLRGSTRQAWFTVSIKPWRPPQMTKVQFAPC